ncbi:Fibroblast growth factor receptor homolog 2 [Eumeta japonica]|uniref:Fibroblast growth factor receptor homolog 2 n=1 Tax=Eumeta variegata TaxID=151549 RepID=A0A4C1TLS4_EUMVA|nr:Fibroblast growth factor receptor homolog 2 [Eumeta japonica]
MERDQDKPNILNFTKVSHDDEGWYTCGGSSLGQTVASAYLKVVDKLPQRDVLQRGHPNSNWEISRSQLVLGSTLGEGAFGRVVMAQGSNLPRVSSNGAATTIVAVKMVKEEHTDADMASLVREMEILVWPVIFRDTDYYRNTNGRLPIKWMAPESLQEKFYDSQSDVWSLRCFIMGNNDVWRTALPEHNVCRRTLQLFNNRTAYGKPPRCSPNIYMLMRQCWHFDSTARPTFTEIVENLDKILQLTSTANEEYLDLSMPMLETPPSLKR